MYPTKNKQTNRRRVGNLKRPNKKEEKYKTREEREH